jgi:hypothetical protein
MEFNRSFIVNYIESLEKRIKNIEALPESKFPGNAVAYHRQGNVATLKTVIDDLKTELFKDDEHRGIVRKKGESLV